MSPLLKCHICKVILFNYFNIYLKIEDLYKLKMLKCHFNPIRGTLQSKFDIFCPKQSLVSNCYKIRDPKYGLPKFKKSLCEIVLITI